MNECLWYSLNKKARWEIMKTLERCKQIPSKWDRLGELDRTVFTLCNGISQERLLREYSESDIESKDFSLYEITINRLLEMPEIIQVVGKW